MITFRRFRTGDLSGSLEDMRDEGAELGGADCFVHVAVEQSKEEFDALLAGASHHVPRNFLERLKRNRDAISSLRMERKINQFT